MVCMVLYCRDNYTNTPPLTSAMIKENFKDVKVITGRSFVQPVYFSRISGPENAQSYVMLILYY